MKNFFKFCFVLTLLLLVGSFFVTQNASASGVDYQTITLSSGWNIISTPKVLLSHQFSVAETSGNFDIYLLDPTSSSGWQTMQGAVQTEFQPLFSYFINNKTGVNQTLRLNYNFELTPAQRLFQRTLQSGWNTIGVASPSYALIQGSSSTDRNNPSNILNSITNVISQVIDFTNGNPSLDSPAISDNWLSKTTSDVNSLNDFRELKGYGVFVTTTTNNYLGSQNLELSEEITPVMTVTKKSDSPSANIVVGASDQTLATYTFTASNEDIKVNTLKVGILQTGGGASSVSLRNVRILVNGAQVGSNTTVPAETSFSNNTGTQFTTNFIVYPSTPAAVEIHADVFDNEGIDEISSGAVTSVQALLVGGSSSNNATGQISLATTNVPSVDNVMGNNLTIGSGSMSLAKTSSYANQVAPVPTTAYKIGSYQLTGNSTEAVNLNTIYVGWTTASTVVEPTDLSDLYVVYGGTMTPVKGSVAGSTTGATASDNSNSWSVNKTLGINETMQIDVYATLASSVSTNVINPTLAVAGTTASSGVAVYADSNTGNSTLDAGVTGQTITGSAGTIVLSKDASSAIAQIVDDSGTIKTLTAKFVATTDSYTVTDITVTVPATGVTSVSTVTLKDHNTGAVVGAAKPAAASMTWSGLSMPVNASQTVQVDVELALAPVGVGAGTSDGDLTTVMTTYTARDSAGTSNVAGAGTVSGSATGSGIYVYKAIPLVSAVALPDSNLAAKTGGVIAKFTVSSNGTGTIAWKQVMFEINKTATPTLTSVALYNADTGEAVTAAYAFQNGASGVATTCVGDNTSCELLITVGTNADDNVVEQVSGAKTYEVRATIGGAINSTTDNLSLTLDRNTVTHTGKNDFVTNENTGAANNASFVWSDESASATSDTGVTTWNDDFLMKNLPINWSLN